MVAVPCECHIPKSLQQRHLRAFSQCSLTPWLAAPCSYPSSSLRAVSHLDLNPGVFARGLRESVLGLAMLVQLRSCSVWEVALPKVSGCCKLGNAVGSCSRHPEPPREQERGWKWGWQIHSQLILVNRAANCGLAEWGGSQGSSSSSARTCLEPFPCPWQVSSRSQRGNTASSVPRRSSARSGSRHSGEPGELSPRSQGSAGGSGLCSGIRNWEGSAYLLPDKLPSSSK